MKIVRKFRRKPIIPINSMSDIAFLLLIFIMLISLINYRREVKINYAEAEFQEVTQSENNLEIWINAPGHLFVKGAEVSLNALEQIIATSVVENPDVRIHILADRDTPYKHVNSVMEILKLLQHRIISLVVKETGSS
ncbi:MAG: biopolymer transporter ExbD [Spirochaetales bacterium]|nr:biopolymer transporter ExbD [Spirochaetales bacterium]